MSTLNTQLFKPGTLVKFKDDCWGKESIDGYYTCYSNRNTKKIVLKRNMCGQIAEIIYSDDDCYKVWLPILEVYATCFCDRFEAIGC